MSATVRQRMVQPQVAYDVGLQPLLKRVVYIGLMMLAEDSGCFIWNPRDVRSASVPLEADVTDDVVEGILRDLERDDFIWTYEAEGVACGFLPAFPQWQKSLTRWNLPESVPLPPGITFDALETANRYGSCKYHWPKSRQAMLRAPSSRSSNEVATPSSKPFNQGPASSLHGACRQAAPQAAERCIQCDGAGAINGMTCEWCRGNGWVMLDAVCKDS